MCWLDTAYQLIKIFKNFSFLKPFSSQITLCKLEGGSETWLKKQPSEKGPPPLSEDAEAF
jgi:hypothetical protein